MFADSFHIAIEGHVPSPEDQTYTPVLSIFRQHGDINLRDNLHQISLPRHRPSIVENHVLDAL